MGFAGPRQRFVVVAHASVQDACPGDGCTAYLFDSLRPLLKRRYVRHFDQATDGRSLFQTYREALPAAVVAAMEPWVPFDPDTAHELALDPTKSASDGRSLAFRLESHDLLRVDLATRRRFPSMRVDWVEPCAVVWGKDQGGLCSTCHEEASGWVCRGPGVDEAGNACDCSAVGAELSLRLVRERTGATALGERFALLPYDMAPNDVSDASRALDLAWPGDPIRPTVAAVVTESAVVVVGDAAHARYGWGTYLPVVAALPLRTPPGPLRPAATPGQG